MPRIAILAFTLIATVTVFAVFAAWSMDEPVHTLRTPELGPAPVAVRVQETTQPPQDSSAETRIGSFRHPETVPRYEILEESEVQQEDVRAARLLVDTGARSKVDYELIAQDLKARYAEYDAVTAEFTDSETVLDYNGAALIFNTMQGASYMGYYYGPINNQGYYVRTTE